MNKFIILVVAMSLISVTCFADKIESNDSKNISSTIQCKFDKNIKNQEHKITYSLIKNGVTILKKDLPLSNNFFSYKIDDCLQIGKYSYIAQDISTDDPYISKKSIIYLHQLDDKGKIINSIEPFSNAWSCWNGHLDFKNSSNLQVFAECLTEDNTNKKSMLDQNLTMNLKKMNLINKELDSSDLKLNQPIVLTGTIIGPITVGNKSEGNNFTAFYLKLNKNYVLDDQDSCGQQIFNKLAIEKFGLNIFKGKKVRVEGNIYCQPERTGTYRLNEIKNISIMD